MSKGLHVRLRKQYRNCMYSVLSTDTMEIKTRKMYKILTDCLWMVRILNMGDLKIFYVLLYFKSMHTYIYVICL